MSYEGWLGPMRFAMKTGFIAECLDHAMEEKMIQKMLR